MVSVRSKHVTIFYTEFGTHWITKPKIIWFLLNEFNWFFLYFFYCKKRKSRVMQLIWPLISLSLTIRILTTVLSRPCRTRYKQKVVVNRFYFNTFKHTNVSLVYLENSSGSKQLEKLSYVTFSKLWKRLNIVLWKV